MSSSLHCVVLFVCAIFFEVWWGVEASRILVVVPTPAHSHQVVFRPFTQELARRGHQVVVLTTHPAFPPGQVLPNLTEIDLHDISHKTWTEEFQKLCTGIENDFIKQLQSIYDLLINTFRHQMQTKEVKEILADKTQQFDLVVMEYWVEPALALAHIYHCPVIMMSTLGNADEAYEYMGGPIHPIIYPDIVQTRRYNLSKWEQSKKLYNRIEIHRLIKSMDETFDIVIRDLIGEDAPSIKELRKNMESILVNCHPVWEGYRPVPLDVVHLGGMNYELPKELPESILVNCHPVWEGYRPVPLDVVHLGGMNYELPKELPEEFKSLMDSSEHGVIYMSFGSGTNPSLLPPDRMEVFARVFASLPYSVLWKWKDSPRSMPSNVHTFSWLPQPDLLRHERIVLFITQCGLQSTDEALRAGVPLLGIPLLGDQWINAENYERLGVGMFLDLYTLSETQLKEAIETLINDKSYRESSLRVGREMYDRPQSVLARAVWRAERALRLRGRRMSSPPPPLTWDGLLDALLLAAFVVPPALIFGAIFLYKIFRHLKRKVTTTCRRYILRTGLALPRAS